MSLNFLFSVLFRGLSLLARDLSPWRIGGLSYRRWAEHGKEKNSNLVVVESLLKHLFSELEDAQTKATNRLV